MLRTKVEAEESARGGVSTARQSTDAADRVVRELRDTARRLELERENA